MNCPYCKAKMIKGKVHTGRYYSPDMLKCVNYPKCNTYVGCHIKSGEPFGVPADAELRNLRKQVHKKINPLWQKYEGALKMATRGVVYDLLSEELNKPESLCKVSMFDKKDCFKALKALDAVQEKIELYLFPSYKKGSINYENSFVSEPNYKK